MTITEHISLQDMRASVGNTEMTGPPIQGGQSAAENFVEAVFETDGAIELGLEVMRIVVSVAPSWLLVSVVGIIGLLLAIGVYRWFGGVLSWGYRWSRDLTIAGKHIADDRLSAAWYRLRGNDPLEVTEMNDQSKQTQSTED